MANQSKIEGHGDVNKFDPMHQFEIQNIGDAINFYGLDMSFTNAALWMMITVLSSVALLLLSTRNMSLIPNRLQSVGEMFYEFIANMLRENTGQEGIKYFSFVFTLFVFILFSNLLGLLPYSFTVTSHLIVTFALASVVFVLITMVGLIKHGLGFFRLFAPAGVPVILLPLLIVIEFISYLTRPLSLSVRLFANMLAGHTMLKVFASFVTAILAFGGFATIGTIAPFAMMVGLTGLELLIAFLQAYVFAILTCIYLNDVIHIDH